MSTITLFSPQTAAGTGSLLVTDIYNSVVLHADGLAAAEEVDVYVMGGTVRTRYTEAGVNVVLTAGGPSAILPPGPTYSIDKDATAGLCGVYASVAADIGN